MWMLNDCAEFEFVESFDGFGCSGVDRIIGLDMGVKMRMPLIIGLYLFGLQESYCYGLHL